MPLLGLFILFAVDERAGARPAWTAIAKAASVIHDASFGYEVESGDLNGDRIVAKNRIVARGACGATSEGVYSHRREWSDESGRYSERLSMRRNGRQVAADYDEFERPIGRRNVCRSHYILGRRLRDYPANFWPWPMFWIMSDEQLRRIQVEGEELVDGRPCRKVRLDHAQGEKGASETIFWFDMNRGANVVRADLLMHGELCDRLHRVELAQCKGADGKEVWLPVVGVFDKHNLPDEKTREWIFRKEPLYRVVWRVARDSVRVNTLRKAQDFESGVWWASPNEQKPKKSSSGRSEGSRQ